MQSQEGTACWGLWSYHLGRKRKWVTGKGAIRQGTKEIGDRGKEHKEDIEGE